MILIAVVEMLGIKENFQPFAFDILNVGATGQGLLLSISGIGAIAGSLLLASLPNKKRGLMLLISAFILGLTLALFSFSSSWLLSCIFIALVGLGQSGRMTLGSTLLQYYVENEYRGRVMSIYVMEFGLSSLGTFFAGILSGIMGVQWAVGGFAIILSLIAMAVIIFSPRLRNLD